MKRKIVLLLAIVMLACSCSRTYHLTGEYTDIDAYQSGIALLDNYGYYNKRGCNRAYSLLPSNAENYEVI